ncbi:dehydrogenase [ubiquinone] 1 beta subcomplex subunit 8, mitochondrial-like [Octopus vulgaris]|uniref:Dehydrogenase [ubiquinone] 1 beta subcomplex subunit 8, mitochondrial-like n=1 Tax=Octopus vulgaris TaxID=6645 RepID=A0AA36EZL5_OCTVU|nr:dehydrogenase [ubiquinone] 1 beta subcomplex subunit 8, mitochondrial-like [Octopus vulgaris]
MASFRSFNRAVSAFRSVSSVNQIRKIHIGRPLAAYWNHDWQPEKFPETPEERARAAKKYGLRLEDYEPYPNDGTGLGDYPKLPPVSAEGRNPYMNWDMPELKRNFGEPMHAESNWLTEDRMSPDVIDNLRHSLKVQALVFFGILGGVALAAYLTSSIVLHPAVMPKQYPFNNLHIERGGDAADVKPVVHYTFEPAE